MSQPHFYFDGQLLHSFNEVEGLELFLEAIGGFILLVSKFVAVSGAAVSLLGDVVRTTPGEVPLRCDEGGVGQGQLIGLIFVASII